MNAGAKTCQGKYDTCHAACPDAIDQCNSYQGDECENDKAVDVCAGEHKLGFMSRPDGNGTPDWLSNGMSASFGCNNFLFP